MASLAGKIPSRAHTPSIFGYKCLFLHLKPPDSGARRCFHLDKSEGCPSAAFPRKSLFPGLAQVFPHKKYAPGAVSFLIYSPKISGRFSHSSACEVSRSKE